MLTYRSDWPLNCQLESLERERPVQWSHISGMACVTLGINDLISKAGEGPGLCQQSLGLSPSSRQRRGLCVPGSVLTHCVSPGWASWVMVSDDAEVKLDLVDMKS